MEPTNSFPEAVWKACKATVEDSVSRSSIAKTYPGIAFARKGDFGTVGGVLYDADATDTLRQRPMVSNISLHSVSDDAVGVKEGEDWARKLEELKLPPKSVVVVCTHGDRGRVHHGASPPSLSYEALQAVVTAVGQAPSIDEANRVYIPQGTRGWLKFLQECSDKGHCVYFTGCMVAAGVDGRNFMWALNLLFPTCLFYASSEAGWNVLVADEANGTAVLSNQSGATEGSRLPRFILEGQQGQKATVKIPSDFQRVAVLDKAKLLTWIDTNQKALEQTYANFNEFRIADGNALAQLEIPDWGLFQKQHAAIHRSIQCTLECKAQSGQDFVGALKAASLTKMCHWLNLLMVPKGEGGDDQDDGEIEGDDEDGEELAMMEPELKEIVHNYISKEAVAIPSAGRSRPEETDMLFFAGKSAYVSQSVVQGREVHIGQDRILVDGWRFDLTGADKLKGPFDQKLE